MTRPDRRWLGVLGLWLAVSACGGGAASSTTTAGPTSTAAAPATTVAVTSTVAPTTTIASVTTTIRMPVPDVSGITDRDEFLQLLDGAGWAEYDSSPLGFSIRHPAEWTVQEFGETALLLTPSGLVTFGAMIGTEAFTSADELLVAIVFDNASAGLYEEPEAADFGWLDRDLSGGASFGDIARFSGAARVDPEGSLLPGGGTRPVFYWVYFEPDVDSSFAITFDSLGIDDPDQVAILHLIVMSFEPPAA